MITVILFGVVIRPLLLPHAHLACPSHFQVHLELDFEAIPVLPGAWECLKAGQLSSLHRQNSIAVSLVDGFDGHTDGRSWLSRDPRWPILVDPQTAGGLLAGIPEVNKVACLDRLRAEGYGEAAVIGRVSSRQWEGAAQCISVVTVVE